VAVLSFFATLCSANGYRLDQDEGRMVCAASLPALVAALQAEGVLGEACAKIWPPLPSTVQQRALAVMNIPPKGGAVPPPLGTMPRPPPPPTLLTTTSSSAPSSPNDEKVPPPIMMSYLPSRENDLHCTVFDGNDDCTWLSYNDNQPILDNDVCMILTGETGETKEEKAKWDKTASSREQTNEWNHIPSWNCGFPLAVGQLVLEYATEGVSMIIAVLDHSGSMIIKDKQAGFQMTRWQYQQLLVSKVMGTPASQMCAMARTPLITSPFHPNSLQRAAAAAVSSSSPLNGPAISSSSSVPPPLSLQLTVSGGQPDTQLCTGAVVTFDSSSVILCSPRLEDECPRCRQPRDKALSGGRCAKCFVDAKYFVRSAVCPHCLFSSLWLKLFVHCQYSNVIVIGNETFIASSWSIFCN
jgi:hypothetical protein